VSTTAILGCGPAGLLAAEAANRAGQDVRIFSRKVKSIMPGAQYVHSYIPGVTPPAPDGELRYATVGTRRGYATKVYGRPDAPCSWDHFARPFPVRAWQMSKVYDYLWDRWHENILREYITPVTTAALALRHNHLICTVPRPSLCQRPDEHQFEFAEVYITFQAAPECPDQTIIYNGDLDVPWYRTSMIFGHGSTEWISDPGGNRVVGIKPTRHNCDCLAQIRRAGRFGLWQKGVLVHDAFGETEEYFHALH
jgi:hypothetical protein